MKKIVSSVFIPVVSALAMALMVTGCTKEEHSDFSGTDNHIAAFELTHGGVTYKAAITGDQIVVTVPQGVSLNGATASVTLSENARIAPDPATITDWDREEQFVVTSKNNERKAYLYLLSHAAINTSGNVVLSTQAEVDASEATGISVIDGNLTIGKTVGSIAADSISDLSGLKNLTQVAYNVTVNNTYAGGDLDGLAGLEKAGGLKIGNIASLREVSLPVLTTVGTVVSVTAASIEKVDFPELRYVGEGFTVKSDSLTSADLGSLAFVGGDLIFNGTNGSAQKNAMKTVSLPALEEVDGALTLSYWAEAEKLEVPLLHTVGGAVTLAYWSKIDELGMPALRTGGGLTLNYANNVTEIYFPVLEELNGVFSVSNMLNLGALELPALRTLGGKMTFSANAVTEASFPVLETAGDISLTATAANLERIGFPVLREVSGTLEVLAPKMTNLDGFPALETVGTKLYLYNVSNLTSVSGMKSLARVGTYQIYNVPNVGVLDLRGVEIGTLQPWGTTLIGAKFIGDDEFSGVLDFNGASNNAVTAMPEMEGFRSVSGLKASSFGNGMVDFSLPGIEVVRNNAEFTLTYATAIRMEGLKKVGSVTLSYCNALTTLEFPALKEVAGYTDASGNSYGGFTWNLTSAVTAIELPALQRVMGNLTLGLSTRPVTRLDFSSLQTVTGMLSVTGSSSSVLEDVSSFENLTSAGAVTLTTLPKVVSFDGFRNVVGSLDGSTWTVSGCGYNPSWQDMADGKYRQ